MKNYFFVITLISFITITNNACTLKNIDFKKGYIITRDNLIRPGYIQVDEFHETFINYKNSINDTAQVIPYSDINAIKAGEDSFIVIKKKQVKDFSIRFYNYKTDILTKVEEDGAVLLLSHCKIYYSSSMFVTEKYEGCSHILETKGKSDYCRVSYNPDEFFEIAELFFSDDVKLMKEIKEADYTSEYEDSDSTDGFNYKTVSWDQIKMYVKKYNDWKKRITSKNK